MPLDQKTLLNAVKEAKEKSGKKKFNQTVELILDIQEIDMKSPEGRIQEIVELPYSTAKPNKVCVIASGELALKARKANADYVIERSDLEGMAGQKKQLRKLASKNDIFIAEAPLMPLVGRVLGGTLGPKGKMPTPVPPTGDIGEQIGKHRKIVAVRVRGQPVLQCRVGTEEMKNEEIVENVQTVIRRIQGKLKRGLKNIRSVILKTTMGPLVKVKM